jgi:hypothetical protein
MTRVILLIAGLVLLAVPVSYAGSQGYGGAGPRVGLTIAWWSGSDADKVADGLSAGLEAMGLESCHFSDVSRLGFSIGGFVRYDINRRFAIQPEASYIMKGMKYEGTCFLEGYRIDIDYVYEADYFEFPALGVAKFGSPEGTTFELLFGPYVALNVGSAISMKVSILGDSEEEEVDYEGLDSMDMGIILGAGVTHPSGITVDVRYSRGLQSIHEDDDMLDVSHTLIAVTAGFVF